MNLKIVKELVFQCLLVFAWVYLYLMKFGKVFVSYSQLLSKKYWMFDLQFYFHLDMLHQPNILSQKVCHHWHIPMIHSIRHLHNHHLIHPIVFQ